MANTADRSPIEQAFALLRTRAQKNAEAPWGPELQQVIDELDIPPGTVDYMQVRNLLLTLTQVGASLARAGAPALSNNLTWTANRAIYVPFSLPWSYTVKRLFCVNGGTVAGNISMGIYKLDGTSLYTSASVAHAGTSTLQYFTPGSPISLPQGSYFVAIAFSSASALTYGAAVTTDFGRAMGLYQEALGGLPVPATATFAQWAATGYPQLGITRTASGF